MVVWLCLALAAFLGGCADTLSIQARSYRQHLADPVRRVAVVDFAGNAGQAAADLLTMHLQRSGYDVVERQYLSDMLRGALRPIEEGQTDATLTERVGKMGKLLNADAVITGDLVTLKAPRYERKSRDRLKYSGAVCELAARAFDVRTREVFWTAVINVTATAKNGQDLGILAYMDEACAELAECFANPDYKQGRRVYRGGEIRRLRETRATAHPRFGGG
jgi:curli biogenesis system outer membrane secretion channel CsgG